MGKKMEIDEENWKNANNFEDYWRIWRLLENLTLENKWIWKFIIKGILAKKKHNSLEKNIYM